MRIETLRFAPRTSRAFCNFENLSGQTNIILNKAGMEGEIGFAEFLCQALHHIGMGPSQGPTDRMLGGLAGTGEITFERDGIRRTLRLHPGGVWEPLESRSVVFQASPSIYAVPFVTDIQTFLTVYIPRNSHVDSYGELLGIAKSRGLSLSSTTLESPRRRVLVERIADLRRTWALTAVPADGERYQLVERRNYLTKRLEDLRLENQRRHAAWEASQATIRNELIGLRAEVDRRQSELRVLDERVHDRQSALSREYQRLEEGRRRLVVDREEERRQLDSCLHSASEMRRQMEARSRVIEDRLKNAADADESLNGIDSESICLVETLSRQIDSLYYPERPVSSYLNLDVPHTGYTRQPSHYAREMSPQALAGLRAEVHRLCQYLQGRRVRDRYESMRDELGHIEQCVTMLDDWAHDLEKQRQSLESELNSLHQHGADLTQTPEASRNVADYLDDYGRVLPERLSAVVHSCKAAEVRRPEDDSQLRDLLLRRDQARTFLEEAQRRLSDREGRRHADGIFKAEDLDAEIERTQRDLAVVESQMRHWEEIVALETELAQIREEVRISPLATRVNELLRQLSSGKWLRVQNLDASPLYLEDNQGTLVNVLQAGRETQQRLLLSFRLALAEQFVRQGLRCPFVVRDAQTEFLTSQELEYLADQVNCLGCQVFLLVHSNHRDAAYGLAARGIRVFEMVQEAVGPLNYVEQVRFEPLASISSEAFPFVPSVDPRPVRTFEYHPEQGEPRKFRVDTPHQDEPREWVRDERVRNSFNVQVTPNYPYDYLADGQPFSQRTFLSQADVIPADVVHYLANQGMRTVGDFLRAVSSHGEAESRAWNVPPGELRRWRQTLSFRCLLPELNSADVKILVGCGIHHPSSLADADELRLHEAVQNVLDRSAGGADHSLARSRYTRGRISNWIRYAQTIVARRRDNADLRERNQPQERAIYRDRPRRRRRIDGSRRPSREVNSDRTLVPAPVPKRQRGPVSPSRVRTRTRIRKEVDSKSMDLRYFLNPQDSVVDAPSIGTKTALALEQLGIRTVHDFLAADATDLAIRLNLPRIKPETFLEWQQQALLASRVPELRGHDAQILVACGIRTPEELAAFSAAELWARIRPYTLTSECKRLVRGSRLPDEAEIADWIRFAKESRQTHTSSALADSGPR